MPRIVLEDFRDGAGYLWPPAGGYYHARSVRADPVSGELVPCAPALLSGGAALDTGKTCDHRLFRRMDTGQVVLLLGDVGEGGYSFDGSSWTARSSLRGAVACNAGGSFWTLDALGAVRRYDAHAWSTSVSHSLPGRVLLSGTTEPAADNTTTTFQVTAIRGDYADDTWNSYVVRVYMDGAWEYAEVVDFDGDNGVDAAVFTVSPAFSSAPDGALFQLMHKAAALSPHGAWVYVGSGDRVFRLSENHPGIRAYGTRSVTSWRPGAVRDSSLLECGLLPDELRGHGLRLGRRYKTSPTVGYYGVSSSDPPLVITGNTADTIFYEQRSYLGRATGVSGKAIADSSANWTAHQWRGCACRLDCGEEYIVEDNTSQTLTLCRLDEDEDQKLWEAGLTADASDSTTTTLADDGESALGSVDNYWVGARIVIEDDEAGHEANIGAVLTVTGYDYDSEGGVTRVLTFTPALPYAPGGSTHYSIGFAAVGDTYELFERFGGGDVFEVDAADSGDQPVFVSSGRVTDLASAGGRIYALVHPQGGMSGGEVWASASGDLNSWSCTCAFSGMTPSRLASSRGGLFVAVVEAGGDGSALADGAGNVVWRPPASTAGPAAPMIPSGGETLLLAQPHDGSASRVYEVGPDGAHPVWWAHDSANPDDLDEPTSVLRDAGRIIAAYASGRVLSTDVGAYDDWWLDTGYVDAGSPHICKVWTAATLFLPAGIGEGETLSLHVRSRSSGDWGDVLVTLGPSDPKRTSGEYAARVPLGPVRSEAIRLKLSGASSDGAGYVAVSRIVLEYSLEEGRVVG